MTHRLILPLMSFTALSIIYFWLCWVFTAAQALTSCGEQGLLSSCWNMVLIAMASRGARALGHVGFSGCSS